MDSKQIIEQLLELSLSLDYMDQADGITQTIDTLTYELEKIKDFYLYKLLENVAYMNESDTPLLNQLKEHDSI